MGEDASLSLNETKPALRQCLLGSFSGPGRNCVTALQFEKSDGTVLKGGTVRPIGAAILIVFAAIAVGCARQLYVDAGAPTGGDGSKAKPFKTIREGVTAARARTTIHVAKGAYVEELDTTFARSNVKLKGSTVLPLDRHKLPTGVAQEAAILTPTGSGQALFQIHARNVEIEGFQLDGQIGTATSAGILINVDGAKESADGFSVEKNVLVNANVAVATRMAAGKIRGNYIAKQQSHGALICGWPAQASAPERSVVFERNRVTENHIIGALFFGSVGSLRSPTFQTLGLLDQGGTLRVEISANEFECKGSEPLVCPSRTPNTGVYFIVSDNQVSESMKHARIDAVVRGNTFKKNIWYGAVVGQRIQAGKTSVGYEFDGTFLRNKYSGTRLNAAAFTFQHIVSTQGSTTPAFQYGQDSTYTINSVHDPLAGIDFDYDNPPSDSTRTELKNKLIVNGRSYDGQLIKHCPPPAGTYPQLR
jgi:hypothetical protein